jgi:hypothetical protein
MILFVAVPILAFAGVAHSQKSNKIIRADSTGKPISPALSRILFNAMMDGCRDIEVRDNLSRNNGEYGIRMIKPIDNGQN